MAKRQTPMQVEAANKLTGLIRENDRLKTVNHAQNASLTLARQANAALDLRIMHAAALLRAAADQFAVRNAVSTAQLCRYEADLLDPPSRAIDCQGEFSAGFASALAGLKQPANLQLDRGRQ